jgi:hypothetical protein
LRRTIAEHQGHRRVHNRQSIQRPFGAKLLKNPNRAVDDYDEAEKPICRGPNYQHCDEEKQQQGIEPREQVRTQNVLERTAGLLMRIVGLTRFDPSAYLGGSETFNRIDIHRLDFIGRNSTGFGSGRLTELSSAENGWRC